MSRRTDHENHEPHENKDFRGSLRIFFKDECYAIQGAIFEVYREMGCGFLESVYQECLEKELATRGIPFRAQSDLQLAYKGFPLKQTYKPDLICYDQIIVELKAVKELAAEHEAQILNYLKSTGMRLGLLVNFGSYPKATIKRFAL
jgi:GxxExxY protein